MNINLISGRLESDDNLDGWTITSKFARAEGNEDFELVCGDWIDLRGDVYRNNMHIANIS